MKKVKKMKKIIINGYTFYPIKLLGKGSFGKVYEVEQDGKKYALKIIKNNGIEGIKSLKEIDILNRIYHPNITHSDKIISEYDMKNDEVTTGVLMEIADSDLYKIITDKKITTSERINILYDVSKGLKYLHDSKYLHMDIKPVNILLFNQKIGSLGDFGLSLILENKNGKQYKYFPKETMTVDHRSIEALNDNRYYTTADDIWSLGITFLETLSGGKSLFSDFRSKDFTEENVKKVFEKYLSAQNIKATLNIFFKNLKEPTKSNAINLVSKMLAFEPSQRATIEEVLNSPLFRKMKQKKGEIKRLQPQIIKTECNYIIYEGFDTMLRIATRIPISLETFFLAVDIYQRILVYRHSETGDNEEDYRNIVYTACIALYIATKMIESYFVDPEIIVSLADNLFTKEELIKGEIFIVNKLNGVIYPENLFTSSTTLDRILKAFELSRNCFIYRKLDLSEWKKLSQKEEKISGKYDKYIPFNEFIGQTDYYKMILEDPDRNYIQTLYEEDMKKEY